MKPTHSTRFTANGGGSGLIPILTTVRSFSEAKPRP